MIVILTTKAQSTQRHYKKLRSLIFLPSYLLIFFSDLCVFVVKDTYPMRKRSKKSQKGKPRSSKKSAPNMTENVAYYFLAAIGLVIIALIIAGILGYFDII